MRTSLIVKINFLLLGLGLTIYFSYLVRTRGLNPELLSLFGIEAPAVAGQNVDSANLQVKANKFKWTWCDTRVTAMIRPSQFKIAQEGNLWVYESAVKQAVNFLSVEKWLANFCTVEAKKVNELPKLASEEFRPELMVKFVDGHVEVLRRAPDGRYLWRDQVFTSEEFDLALAELSELPKAQVIKSK